MPQPAPLNKSIEPRWVTFDPDRILSPKIHRFYDIWCTLWQGDRMPHPSAIDPLDFDFALSLVSLIDVIGPEPRYYLRLVGPDVADRHGRDFTGQYVDEIDEEPVRRLLIPSYGKVYHTREPFWALRDTYVEGIYWQYEVLILPLVDESDAIIRLISMVQYLHP